MAEKVNPYLRPLYDALHDMMDFERADQLSSAGSIEVAPLAFMRGRTLNDAFVILDEAQNTTSEQMKMFLTRLGFDSKAVITGDVTQIDLPDRRALGPDEARRPARRTSTGIAFCYFTEVDVVRHPLVQQIIKAYDGGRQAPRAQADRGDSKGRASTVSTSEAPLVTLAGEQRQIADSGSATSSPSCWRRRARSRRSATSASCSR